jgi:hypothetical protein
MYNFIVGGYIPGTNIQVSYQAWLAFTTVFFGGGTLAWIEYKEKFYKFLGFINQILAFLNFDQDHKKGLHASELHARIQYSA